MNSINHRNETISINLNKTEAAIIFAAIREGRKVLKEKAHNVPNVSAKCIELMRILGDNLDFRIKEKLI